MPKSLKIAVHVLRCFLEIVTVALVIGLPDEDLIFFGIIPGGVSCA